MLAPTTTANRWLLEDLAGALGVRVDEAVETLAARARVVKAGRGYGSWIARAFELGIAEVVVKDLGLVDGRLRPSIGGKYIIELNSRRPRSRQLFSLAHELGHLMLERSLPQLASGSKERNLFHSDFNRAEERLADQCAAAMLMPADAVRESLAVSRFVLDAAINLSWLTGVSLSASCCRIRELTDHFPTPIEFRLAKDGNSLLMTQGSTSRLPFRGVVGNRWAVPLTTDMLGASVGSTIKTLIPVEAHPGIFEHYSAEFRWMDRFRAVTVFAYQHIAG